MPAKGRYFLNEGEEDPSHDTLYEKYRLTSQHGPLLLTLLLVAITACAVLIVIAFSYGDPSRHQACLVRRWLRASALLVWACLVTLGYVLVFDSWMKEACDWEQVPFFLFVVFVVYTLLPFSTRVAVVGVPSPAHQGGRCPGAWARPDAEPAMARPQLLANAVVFLCGNLTGAFHKHQMQDASRDLFTYTVKCIQTRRKLRIEKRQQENLLLSVLPAHISMGMKLAIIERLKERGDRRYLPDNNFHSLYVKRHQNVSILYADIVGFTQLASDCSPKSCFDQIASPCPAGQRMHADQDPGDCYYCVSGLPVSLPSHARNCVKMGLDMCEAIKQVREATGVDISMRVGIHSGNVLCGVIGLRKWQYDVWSHDVSLANRMEAAGVPGRVHITEATLNHLDKAYEVEDGHGQQRDPYLKEMNIRTYLVIDPRSQQPPPAQPTPHQVQGGRDPEKMRASVRMTRYLESWGAARPFAHLNQRESVSSNETPVPHGRRPKAIPLRRHRTPDRSASPKGRSEDDSYDDEMLSAIEGLSSTRPCCSKSDDFSTFGSIFLEKGFEREVRTSEQPQEQGLQGLGWGAGAGHRLSLCWALGLWAPGPGLLRALRPPRVWVLGDDTVIPQRCCPARGALRAISERVETQPLLRASLAVLTIGSLLTVAVINLVGSAAGMAGLAKTPRAVHASGEEGYYTCSCILAFIACSVFLRMSLELKVVLLTVALVAYLVLFNISPCWQWDCCGHSLGNLTKTNGTLRWGPDPTLPGPLSPSCSWDLKTMINFYLVLFYTTLIMLSRQIDYYCRLDCLWKKKFKKEHEEFETMENVNRLLLENVLPAHVAAHFIGDKLNEDWYHQSYDCVCVMFASVPDFKVFYTECDVNKEGLECLRLLNEIIADFDELLLKPKFSGVEKIKTIGSTYMAAAGLSIPSGHENQDLERQHAHIGIMVEFSTALMSKLDGINRHSFNSFRLRVGINHGPVIAGVIGARKPQYDIWGNTVNVASRMESTGELGKIQVTEETCTILQGLGYSCECRGLINVKGKGELRTYFVCTDTAKFQGLGLN
uniref:Adenylate cyclase type 7 n=1 Tax=Balaenoptera musculus TaxID=9771 RepID=A0A8C0DGA4_BALMU